MLKGTSRRIRRDSAVGPCLALVAGLAIGMSGCSATPTAPESLAGAPESLSARRPASNGPDLVSDVLFLARVESPGEEKWLSLKTTNQGNEPADESHSRLYLSVDAALDPSDVQIGPDIYVKSLAPGESFWNNGSYGCNTVCDDIPSLHFFLPSVPGTYYYIVEADHYGAVAETNETNNILVKKVLVR